MNFNYSGYRVVSDPKPDEIPSKTDASHTEAIPDRVRRVATDLDDLDLYYNLPNAARRYAKIKEYSSSELEDIKDFPFDSFSQQDKVDIVLLTRFLKNLSRHQTLVEESHGKVQPLVPFESSITALCEARQDGFATKVIEDWRSHLQEWFDFYSIYALAFDWWATTPWKVVDAALASYIDIILSTIVGINPGEGGQDEVVGEPIGRAMLLSEVSHEMIFYTPKSSSPSPTRNTTAASSRRKPSPTSSASAATGKGPSTTLRRNLPPSASKPTSSATLSTKPPPTSRTMASSAPPLSSSASQSILVASPASPMPQALKATVLRANNRHFSRAVALHEMIPGHRLQRVAERRHSTLRSPFFSTPFLTEGWPIYWELLLWDRGDFFAAAEEQGGDRVLSHATAACASSSPCASTSARSPHRSASTCWGSRCLRGTRRDGGSTIERS
ncbi:unnamed protein product [Clonostachys byssicola]|uniref:Uncharacterized protein n=1 Tax=Clonostachys byssicola TaxID=160290 RepID=A0A9N9UUZ0_9HYPO|nr:unnamed protein product [Clonostachys byssicola]